MEVDGKEFLRNVGIEQDKERLVQEQQKLEELKRASVKREQNYMDMDTQANQDESAYVDLSIGSDSPTQKQEHNVDDIVLDSSTNNDNKKKYIVLGLGLVLLFIITVLVIRLISNNDIESQLDEGTKVSTEVVKEDILNKIDSNEEYQKVIDRKIALEESKEIAKKQNKEMNEIIIPEQKVNNVPLVIDTPKPKVQEKRDLFELDKVSRKVVDEQIQKSKQAAKEIKREVKKAVQPKVLSKPKREIVLPPAKEKNFTKNKSSLNGYFIQIGAFTKAPNKNLLRNITAKGYSYTVYKLTIKGKLYNKVLIGSYKTRADATRKLSQIKKDFKNPNAYILKF